MPLWVPIERVLHRLSIRADKHLGQHFLFNESLLDAIASSVRSTGIQGERVLEIGPGPGGLSQAILSRSPKEFVMIEKDARFIPFLSSLKTLASSHCEGGEVDVRVRHEDALDSLLLRQKHHFSHVLGNLPYNVSVPIMLSMCQFQPFQHSAVFMLQYEVAERIARVGRFSRKWTRIAAMMHLHMQNISLVLDVPPEAFSPPPKVRSAVIVLEPRPEAVFLPQAGGFGDREKAVEALFGSGKRKILRNVIPAPVLDDAMSLQVGIKFDGRAEDLEFEQVIHLLNVIHKHKTVVPLSKYDDEAADASCKTRVRSRIERTRRANW
ncbi:mitochondrial transcription factor B-like protein/mitochondrial SSU rRNA dimethyladenosine methyltransferase [Andalucia godoyi]|uniref:rRNA adenine N(6)-methyltransferase n=1 Tax=Andalucia godoyi TaxID=505711 RepID=A0A8K0AGM3_ANDGO|nr:mitochondrial transcription factor B-like protein/mitochondrial SSU rRNA dimethyladenosine methyltransferase [Andalucia godoyi]|eukprot:ANDGO_06793.mRNA.1 mitochondrial transcription factor B-like protein/mitochondrial SSU rRNA dimethyladenosine methyltransferase